MPQRPAAVARSLSSRLLIAERHDKRRYRERWRIEVTFNRLNDFRRIATRYDKLARNYASAVALTAVIPFSTDRVQTPNRRNEA